MIVDSTTVSGKSSSSSSAVAGNAGISTASSSTNQGSQSSPTLAQSSQQQQQSSSPTDTIASPPIISIPLNPTDLPPSLSSPSSQSTIESGPIASRTRFQSPTSSMTDTTQTAPSPQSGTPESTALIAIGTILLVGTLGIVFVTFCRKPIAFVLGGLRRRRQEGVEEDWSVSDDSGSLRHRVSVETYVSPFGGNDAKKGDAYVVEVGGNGKQTRGRNLPSVIVTRNPSHVNRQQQQQQQQQQDQNWWVWWWNQRVVHRSQNDLRKYGTLSSPSPSPSPSPIQTSTNSHSSSSGSKRGSTVSTINNNRNGSNKSSQVSIKSALVSRSSSAGSIGTGLKLNGGVTNEDMEKELPLPPRAAKVTFKE
ncbi:hypothetical protein HDU76_001350 [Blyttiomyces sp. JEL0837]|nr:hypothetical protein HDU76_001350 [Blyttiomyces sp. JEL0837]